jgi:prevent-host-death family protein
VDELMPIAEMRDHLSQVLERVARYHDRVVVTRNGHEVAIVVSPDDLAGLEETVETFADAELMAQLKERVTEAPITLSHEEARQRWAPRAP